MRIGEQPTAVEAVTPDGVAVPGALAESVEEDKVGEGRGHALTTPTGAKCLKVASYPGRPAPAGLFFCP
jgi:hypothetical protein